MFPNCASAPGFDSGPAIESHIAVHCAGGYRSSIAASVLHQYGITHLIEMAGGLTAWEAARLPNVIGEDHAP